MRRIVINAAILIGELAQAGALQAGVYNLDSPRKYPSDYIQTHLPQEPKLVISYLFELRAIQDPPVNPSPPPPPGSLRESYLKQLAGLEKKHNEGILGVTDQVNLSACLIRLGRSSKAQELLEAWLRQVPLDSPFRVLLLLNLASACQEDESLLQRGIEMQRQALECWPALLPGWNREEWTWYRHVEEHALELMQLRNRERILRGDRPAREQLAPDKLFPREERDVLKRVQFVGESGEYEAGGIAWKQWERLPTDADAIVQQLLIWRPSDSRLLWLYGELLNARVKVDGAFYVLNDRVRDQDRWRNRELDRHVRVLSDAQAPYRELFTDSTGSGENLRKQALLLWSLSARGALMAPVIGVAANEIGGVAASTNPAILSVSQKSTDLVSAPRTDPLRMVTALPDWRQLAVSFITGVVVAVLCVLQWQQWRRHRRDESATSVRTASVSERSR